MTVKKFVNITNISKKAKKKIDVYINDKKTEERKSFQKKFFFVNAFCKLQYFQKKKKGINK